MGAIYVLIAGKILIQGPTIFMTEFDVPEAILDSPHYEDAIFFHFLDMFAIGVLIVVAGFAESLKFQRIFCVAMLTMQIAFVVFDVRNSDTFLGSSLYKGPGSVMPVFVGLVFACVFVAMTISAFRYSPSTFIGNVEHQE